MASLPRLAVLSGYPRAGKSTVAGYLQELGFVRIASDPLREMLFGRTAPELYHDTAYEEKEYGLLWPSINVIKRLTLLYGFDVVIDSSAVYNGTRRELLDTGDTEAEKYLIVLKARGEEIIRREMERSGDISYSELLASHWEEPASDLGCAVLEYQSNALEDLEAIRADFQSRFGKGN